MLNIDLGTLIQRGRSIQEGLTYRKAPSNVLRTFAVYDLKDMNEYYNWKELSVRFLQLYSKEDVERFNKYSDEFEEHYYLPQFISNMVGVLEACKAMPTKQMERITEANAFVTEMESVVRLEKEYLSFVHSGHDTLNSLAAIESFHKWHAAASVLFDKCIYAGDEDSVRFQNIAGDGNGYSLFNEYKRLYTVYYKLLNRIREGRGVKCSHYSQTESETKDFKTSEKVNIFISYSHADKKWRELLEKHLKVLKRFFGSIEYWSDTKLKGGDRWREEIEIAIKKANVAILLVSTDFLASDFIASNELPSLLRKAAEEGTRILPLIVSPCAFTYSEIREFQAINSPEMTLADLGDNEAGINRTYLDLINCIREMLPQ